MSEAAGLPENSGHHFRKATNRKGQNSGEEAAHLEVLQSVTRLETRAGSAKRLPQALPMVTTFSTVRTA